MLDEKKFRLSLVKGGLGNTNHDAGGRQITPEGLAGILDDLEGFEHNDMFFSLAGRFWFADLDPGAFTSPDSMVGALGMGPDMSRPEAEISISVSGCEPDNWLDTFGGVEVSSSDAGLLLGILRTPGAMNRIQLFEAMVQEVGNAAFGQGSFDKGANIQQLIAATRELSLPLCVAMGPDENEYQLFGLVHHNGRYTLQSRRGTLFDHMDAGHRLVLGRCLLVDEWKQV